MTEPIATVFGGTGFLGRRVAARLSESGWRTRIAARRTERVGPPFEAVEADIRDEAAVTRAVEGAGAVVNAVGLYVERGDETFEAVHVAGARRLARACVEGGISRLVLISGIGADPRSDSAYVRARAGGEAAVREVLPAATILRPSVLFGPGDTFFNTFARIARTSPVFPLFGDGRTRVQPVYVEDVAEAVLRALTDPAAPGRTYELGGPKAYAYRDLIELVMARVGRRRTLLPLPFPLWSALAALAGLLPNPPLTRDQIALVRRDNLADPALPGLAVLGIEPTPVEAVLPGYLG